MNITSTTGPVNPLSKYRREILYCIEQYSIVILVGTGCTSSSSSSSSSLATYIPLYILDRFYNNENNNSNIDSSTTTTTTLPSILITQSDSQIAYEITQNAKQQLSNMNDHNNNHDFDNIRIGCTTTFQNTNQYHQNQNKNTNNTASSVSSSSSSSSSEYDIHYMTHDIIIHEILNYDPLLMKYSIIIINHIQERTIYIDVLLGLLYTIRKQRYIHIILVCNNSNVYQANLLLQYFIGKKHAQHIIQTTVSTSCFSDSNVPTTMAPVTSELTNQVSQTSASTKATTTTTTTTIKEWNRTGRILSIHEQQLQFPNLTTTDVVDIYYLSEPTHDYIVTLVETIWSIHQQSIESTTMGDILCFVPTYNDIHIAIQLSEEYFDQQITNLISSSSKSSSSNKSSSLYLHKKYNTVDFIQFSNTLPFHLQQQILQNNNNNNHTNRRRRIIYTNINVETSTSLLSISIPNIQYVIDTGLIQLQYFDTMIGLYRSYITPISQQHAMLRTSYAGQYNNKNTILSSSTTTIPSSLSVGQCYRLYTESYINDVMNSTSIPDIVRSDMTQYILLLKSIGIENILTFDFITIPSISNIRYGLETLYILNAIDDTTTITSLGYQIAQFPYYIDPCMARMLLQSITNNCIDDMLIIASIMITVSGPQQQHNDNKQLLQTKPKQHQVQQYMDYDTIMSNFGDMTGDHMSYIHIFHDLDQQYIDLRDYCKEHFLQYNTIRQCMTIRKHLTQFMKRFVTTIDRSNQNTIAKRDSINQNILHDRSTMIRYCITTGYIMNIAKLDVDGQYYTIRNHILVIPSNYSFYTNYTKMSSEYIVFCQAAYDDESNNSNNNTDGIKVQHVSSIEAKWLREIAPHYFE